MSNGPSEIRRILSPRLPVCWTAHSLRCLPSPTGATWESPGDTAQFSFALFFLRFIYFVLCMSILSVCLSMDYLHVWSLWRSERVWDPLVLMCEKLGTIMWALGIKFGSSEKSTSTFKCRAISPVLFSACFEIVYCKDNSKGVMLSHGVIFKMHIP